MGTEHSGQKRRLHIVLSLDNPRHRETWQILSQEKNKTVSIPQIAEANKEVDVAVDSAVLDFLQTLQDE